MLLFPNPYCHLDHLGRLAGACPEAENVRPSGPFMPIRRHVSATLAMTEGSYDKGDPGAGIDPSADVFRMFAAKPLEVKPTGASAAFWLARVRDREVFEVASTEEVPLKELAKARADAIANYVAHYGSKPSMMTWKIQFQLDDEVSKECQRLEEEAAELARKSKAKSKPAPVESKGA